jgi:hypothetical protein
VKTKQRDQEYERISSQLETITTAAFNVLRVAKERNDLDLTLRTVEAIANLVELRGRMVGTFVPAANGTAHADVPDPRAEVRDI